MLGIAREGYLHVQPCFRSGERQQFGCDDADDLDYSVDGSRNPVTAPKSCMDADLTDVAVAPAGPEVAKR